MRAAVLEEPGQPLHVDGAVELLDPGPGEVQVEISHCGLCHSDVSVMSGQAPAPMPVVLGHEASGVVREVGPGVTSLAAGDHVLLTPIPSCGRCPACLRGQPMACVNATTLLTQTLPDGTTRLRRDGQVVYQGLGVGGFAEQVVVLETGAVKVPDDVDLGVIAVLGCAVQTGVGAVFNVARVEPGWSVLVMGLGGIGVAIVQGARIAGAARIIVSDPVASRRDMAAGFGATDAVDPTAEDVVSACQRLTGGQGVDAAFDAVGSSALVATGVDACRSGGVTVLVGAGPIDDQLAVSRVMVMVTEKRLAGTLLGSASAHREVPRFLDLYRRGQLDLESMVTMRRPLTEINQAVADLTAGRGLRTVLTP